ncbi:hypothetical protein BCV69DRAFT_281399 [Microstroma glucosiphilum]|uniref:Uncharacterized protein n=1 Tax=Pseudomicrostroma glucosiphilum TaxID=1684307 RepID=A0A316UB58_9BASI|nr:hypothetical protein BCV69DRAFT_281399 [Pseudomicrostroma glucosiphilum]PWN22399.1 hypothetical protein BCV69DRAFT_281399 [Pseudomicrostroma glucosiphilum]
MQFSTLPLAVVAAFAATLAIAQSTLTVNTPTTLIECQPAQLSWTGGTAPYYPRITQGGDVSSTLNTFDTTSSTTITWTVNIASGTTVTFAVTDSAGLSNASAEVTIQAGSSSCLNSSSTGASSTVAGASSSSAASSSRATSSSSSAASSSSSATSTRASSSSSSAAATSATSSAAAAATTSAAASGAESLRGFPAAVAGLVGIVAAALL